MPHKDYKPFQPYTTLVDRVQRGEFIRKIVSQVRAHEYPYEKRPPEKVSWSTYDIAQCNEIADVLELIRTLVDSAEEKIESRRPPSKPSPGRPPVAAVDVAKVLLAQSYFDVSNRVAEGLICLFWRNLGLRERFSYKTIERGYDRHAVDELLDEVFTLTNAPVQGLEKVFSIDGSGTPTHVRQNYAEERDRQRREGKTEGRSGGSAAFPRSRHDFVYSVSMVGTRFKLVSAWESTVDHSRREPSFFEPLLRETRERHPGMEMVVGDGAYAARPCCNVASDLGVEPRFLPKRSATLKRKGSAAWVDMLFALAKDPDRWLSDYYRREASESVNSVIKRENPSPLRKRLGARRCTEDRLRGACHNIRRLCYLRYLEPLLSNQCRGIVPRLAGG